VPNYDYRCSSNHVSTRFVSWDARERGHQCWCGADAEYQFPVQAARGFQPFEAYYDEGLGFDVTGRRDKKHIMSALGVQEAGDPVHGARDVDMAAPDHIKPRDPIGAKFDGIREAEPQPWDVSVEGKDGSSTKVDTNSLPSV